LRERLKALAQERRRFGYRRLLLVDRQHQRMRRTAARSLDRHVPRRRLPWVYGVGEDGVPAFTQDDIENLRQIIADERADGPGPQIKPPK
jgi:hypothetical protein